VGAIFAEVQAALYVVDESFAMRVNFGHEGLRDRLRKPVPMDCCCWCAGWPQGMSC